MSFKVESFTDDIMKEIRKSELASRREALKFAAKQMRKNISSRSVSSPGGFPGRRSGGLRKSIRFKLKTGVPDVSFVGSTAPHAHLVEFGHGDGKEQNKRPFVHKTLREEEPKLIEIMSTEYL